LARWRKIPLFCSPPPPKIRRIDFDMNPLGCAGLRLLDMRARLTRKATFQIPIARCLS
jgi:hypothetical protein